MLSFPFGFAYHRTLRARTGRACGIREGVWREYRGQAAGQLRDAVSHSRRVLGEGGPVPARPRSDHVPEGMPVRTRLSEANLGDQQASHDLRVSWGPREPRRRRGRVTRRSADESDDGGVRFSFLVETWWP